LGFDPREVSGLLTHRRTVRTHLVPNTIHLVTAPDRLALHPGRRPRPVLTLSSHLGPRPSFARSSSIVSALPSTEMANQARAVVVAGDLNHEPDAATTLLLTGPPGSKIRTRAFRQPDQGDGHRLWNPRRAHRTARIVCWWVEGRDVPKHELQPVSEHSVEGRYVAVELDCGLLNKALPRTGIWRVAVP
jgi:hypothetical protein